MDWASSSRRTWRLSAVTLKGSDTIARRERASSSAIFRAAAMPSTGSSSRSSVDSSTADAGAAARVDRRRRVDGLSSAAAGADEPVVADASLPCDEAISAVSASSAAPTSLPPSLTTGRSLDETEPASRVERRRRVAGLSPVFWLSPEPSSAVGGVPSISGALASGAAAALVAARRRRVGGFCSSAACSPR